MAGIGAGEWIGLIIVALIVLGPEKLPRYAADAGRMLRQLRTMANNARDEVTKELGPEFSNLDLADLTPRGLVRKHLLEPIDLDDLDDLTNLGLTDGDRPRRPSRDTSPRKPAPGLGKATAAAAGASPAVNTEAATGAGTIGAVDTGTGSDMAADIGTGSDMAADDEQTGRYDEDVT